MPYQAEYIWIDGTKPSPIMRSKTRIVADGKEPDIWGFDGSSTNQAPGANSDCVLRPVYTVPDPIRGRDNILVMCEVELTDFTPHPTNTRAACVATAEKYAAQEPPGAILVGADFSEVTNRFRFQFDDGRRP